MYNSTVSNEKCLLLQSRELRAVGNLTPGKEAPPVGQQASSGGNRQEGGVTHELEEATN